MALSDYLANPFGAAFNASSNAVAKGRKQSKAAAQQQWAVEAQDWLSGQEHSRGMEFMQAQHQNTFDMEKMRGSETRLNMRAAMKNNLSDFSQSMGADGSHSTSFSLREASKALVEQTATQPPAGQAVVPVGGPLAAPAGPAQAQASNATPKAAAAPQAAPQAANRVGKALGAGIEDIAAKLQTGAQVSDEKPGMAPPAHSGKNSKGAKQFKLF